MFAKSMTWSNGVCNSQLMNKGIDFNNILQFFNVAVFITSMFLHFKTPDNPYIDNYVFVMVVLIHAQILFILLYEKRRTDPFLIILCGVIIVFYLFRITTLLYNPNASLTLTRTTLIDNETFYYFLLYVFSCVWAIFFGLVIGEKKSLLNSGGFRYSNDDTKHRIQFVTALLFAAVAVAHYLYFGFIDDITKYPRLIRIMLVFLCYDFSFPLLLTLLFFSKNIISKKLIVLAILCLLVFIVLKTIGGSKGSFLFVGLATLCSSFSVLGRLKMSRFVLKVIILITPIILFSALLGNIYLKEHNRHIKGINAKSDNLYLLKINDITRQETSQIFEQIYTRAGFLDFSVEIFNNPDYGKIVNMGYYFRSLVDTLTPGFDVFNVPLAALNMKGIHALGGQFLNRQDAEKMYHSDQMNVFGESYILFHGYWSLIFVVFFSFCFKSIYVILRSYTRKSHFAYYWMTITLLYFYQWINSFGLDWLIKRVTDAVLIGSVLVTVLILVSRTKTSGFLCYQTSSISSGKTTEVPGD